MANNIKCEIVEDFGIVGYKGQGTKAIKLRLVSWNGRSPQYDLRIWAPGADGNDIAFKGFTLEKEDLETLKDLIDIALEAEV